MVAQKRSIALSTEHSLVARAARERRGVISNNVHADPFFLPNPLLPDTRAEMSIPMIVGDDLMGVLDVQSERTNRFDPEDMRIKTTLAGQVVNAIRNAQLYEATILQSRQLEDYKYAIDEAAIVAITDQTGKILHVNDRFVEVSKYPREELIGQDHRLL